MIRFSRREDYSIILLNKLAQNYKKRVVPLSEIAREYKISILFLRNLANSLRKSKIIRANEGKNGGYFLNKDPQNLKIGEVLSIFSKRPILECCSKNNKENKGTCTKKSFCQTGLVWRKINREFIDKIYSLSLEDFLNYKK